MQQLSLSSHKFKYFEPSYQEHRSTQATHPSTSLLRKPVFAPAVTMGTSPLTFFFVFTTLLPFALGSTWSVDFYNDIECSGSVVATFGGSVAYECTKVGASAVLSAEATGEIGHVGGFSVFAYTEENCGGHEFLSGYPGMCASESYTITDQPYMVSFTVVSNP